MKIGIYTDEYWPYYGLEPEHSDDYIGPNNYERIIEVSEEEALQLREATATFGRLQKRLMELYELAGKKP